VDPPQAGHGPGERVTNFKLWGDGFVQASSTLWFTGNYVTYQQGTAASSTIANTSFTNFTSGNKANWDTATYSVTGSYTKFSVWQLEMGADAGSRDVDDGDGQRTRSTRRRRTHGADEENNDVADELRQRAEDEQLG
jgi:hypothetical protein